MKTIAPQGLLPIGGTYYREASHVSANHSIAAIIVNRILKSSGEATGTLFKHEDEQEDGLFISEDIIGHPMFELVLVHEFAHMKRMFNWLGWQSSGYYLNVIAKRGFEHEEARALLEVYDYIHENYPTDELPILLQDLKTKFNDPKYAGSNARFASYIVHALNKTRAQFVDARLEKYRRLDAADTIAQSKLPPSARFVFGVINFLFGK
jgi:hypothetical protein